MESSAPDRIRELSDREKQMHFHREDAKNSNQENQEYKILFLDWLCDLCVFAVKTFLFFSSNRRNDDGTVVGGVQTHPAANDNRR